MRKDFFSSGDWDRSQSPRGGGLLASALGSRGPPRGRVVLGPGERSQRPGTCVFCKDPLPKRHGSSRDRPDIKGPLGAWVAGCQ